MKANYHTHTARCGHATGTDEDYVLAAIEQGFDELGFSDHVPWPYQDGYTHPSVRMRVDQMPGYLNSVRALAAQYKDKIHILTGFECEYFPDYMNWLADMRAENHLDYLILGNHFDHDDEYGMYFGNTRTAAQLRRYVDSAVKGMESLPEGGERCFVCYRLRLERSAQYAAEHGFDYFCSTLSISPMKNAAKLNEIGAELSELYPVKLLPSDFKKKGGYLRSIELSREYGLYRQNYCGCVFSKQEAQRRENEKTN